MNRRTIIALAMLALAAGALAETPAKSWVQRPQPSPLTFKNVISFFSDTLRFRPTEVQKRCVIFYEGEWKSANTYNYCVIIVENSDEDLQVTYYITDDSEMNWVTEFLDSPFFTRGETENLFRLLHQKRPVRDERVGRFRVDVSHWEPRHAEIIVLSFTPLRSASADVR
jgi:hypothetical protein